MDMRHFGCDYLKLSLLYLIMVERMVQLPVDRIVRDILREKKGTLSYSKYLEKIVGSTFQEKPTNPQNEDYV